MSSFDPVADETAIRELIRDQARRLTWTPEKTADWQGFQNAFLANALIVASARPARTQSVGDFLARMKALSIEKLRTFSEKALNGDIHVFGSIAVAIIASETLEDEREVNRDVSGYLLVKENGRWLIVAQAWDKETAHRPISPAMLSTR